MNERPYISEATNVYNEAARSTAPAVFGGQNLLVNYDQQRRTYDTVTTSILGNQQQHMYGQNAQNLYPFSQHIPGQRQFIPEGVTYTFNPMVQNYALQNFYDPGLQYNQQQQNVPLCPYSQPLTLEQQIALNQLQNHALESMMLHQKIKENPFRLQFHSNCQTDTSDLKTIGETCTCQTDQSPPSRPQSLLKTTLGSDMAKIDINQNFGLNPNSLIPASGKQKRLSFAGDQKSKHQSEQDGANGRSMNTQCDTVTHCDCKDKLYVSVESQTEMRRVSFGVNEVDKQANSKPKPKMVKAVKRQRKLTRPVDDDSDTSSSSADSLQRESSKESL